MLSNDTDHNQYNRYELKVDKLVSRVDNIEILLRTAFSDLESSLSKNRWYQKFNLIGGNVVYIHLP